MASDLIESIKKAELNAEKLKNETEKKVQEIIDKAKKETECIKNAKLKEEMKKAKLRVNIAKSDANRLCKDKKNQAEIEIETMRGNVENKKEQAIKVVIDLVTQ